MIPDRNPIRKEIACKEKKRKVTRARGTEQDAPEQREHNPYLWVPFKCRADIILYKSGW